MSSAREQDIDEVRNQDWPEEGDSAEEEEGTQEEGNTEGVC